MITEKVRSMKTFTFIFSAMLILFFGVSASSTAQTYDLEYIYEKNSEEQENPQFQINLIAKYGDYELSKISKIRIMASNSFKDQRKGQIDHVNLVVEPSKGFVVRDSIIGKEVRKYLRNEVSLSNAQSRIRALNKGAEQLLHPKLFVFSEEKNVKINMGIYASGQVMFDYQVFIEMLDGSTVPLKISGIETILN